MKCSNLVQRILYSLAILAALPGCSSIAYEAEPGSVENELNAQSVTSGKWATNPDPDLPNVLILGDSISIGYTLQVKKHLAGKANVFRPHTANGDKPVNAQGTTLGVERIDEWLAGQKWDVVHFNWGLHDLKHWDPIEKKNSMSFDDPRQAEPQIYRENLTQIVAKLKATGAKLVFATTTPVPEGVKPARKPEDVALYNAIALEIMEQNNIGTLDLYAAVLPNLEELQMHANVHFKRPGKEFLAKVVASHIAELLSVQVTLGPIAVDVSALMLQKEIDQI